MSSFDLSDLESRVFGDREGDLEDLEARYSKEQELGRGAFATVHQVQEKATGQRWACKSILKSRSCRTKRARQQLRTEVNAMKMLNHPASE